MTGKYERYHGTGMPRKPQPSPWATLAIIVMISFFIAWWWSGWKMP